MDLHPGWSADTCSEVVDVISGRGIEARNLIIVQIGDQYGVVVFQENNILRPSQVVVDKDFRVFTISVKFYNFTICQGGLLKFPASEM